MVLTNKTDFQTDSSPIFVVGTPRSGTTLTAKILGKHSRVFMPGETHFFDDIYARRDNIGELENQSARQLVLDRLSTIYQRYYELPDQERITALFKDENLIAEYMDKCNNYKYAFSWFMRIQMHSEGKKRWGNNAPRDLFSYKEIKKLYPDAKFIVCVRDIRAFLLSYKGKWKVVEGDVYVKRMKKLYHPVVTSFLWKSSMQQLMKLSENIDTDDWIIVKYEDLVKDPKKTVMEICEKIGVRFDLSMLEVDYHNSSSTVEKNGIFSTSIDRWRNDLSSEEIAIGQFVGKKEMEWLGYPEIDNSANNIKLLMCWLGSPFALWRALYANRAVRGPLLPYLFKRLGVFFRI